MSQHGDCFDLFKEMKEREAVAKAKEPETARKRGRSSLNAREQPEKKASKPSKLTKPPPPQAVVPNTEVVKDPKAVKDLVLSGKGMFQALFREMVANNKGQVKFSVSGRGARGGGGRDVKELVLHVGNDAGSSSQFTRFCIFERYIKYWYSILGG